MKKYFLPFLLFLLFEGSRASAQTIAATESRHEFKVGYGVLSGLEVGIVFAHAIGSGIGSAISGGSPDDSPVLPGTFSANYNYFFNKRLSLGAQAAITPFYFPDGIYESANSNDKYHWQYFAQTYARLDVYYVTRPRFRMYSGIMAGGLYDFKDGGWYWSGHANLLGFRFGRKHAFYTELGLGVSSTLSAGYSARF